MFFNQQKPKPASAPAAKPDANAVIFDVGAADFEERVLKASMEKPVIVDFWAPWCGPCKQLGPILEAAVTAAKGAVLMAKINLDDNQDLAAAMRIQSVPTVYAFFGGRPVDAFQGAVPESQVKAFVDKLVQIAKQAAPDAIDIPEALKAAAQALAQNELGAAQSIYAQVLAQDENNARAYGGLVRTIIAAGEIEQAAQLVANAPEPIAKDPSFAEVKTALELAQMKPQGSTAEFLKKLQADPNDHQARYDLALAQFTGGQKEEGVNSLLEIISRNRTWNEDEARKQLLKFFEALGPVDPLTIQSRKKLSSILFS